MKKYYSSSGVLFFFSGFFFLIPISRELFSPNYMSGDLTSAGMGEGLYIAFFGGISIVLAVIAFIIGLRTISESTTSNKVFFFLPALLWILYISGFFKLLNFKDDVLFNISSNIYVSSEEGASGPYFLRFGQYSYYFINNNERNNGLSENSIIKSDLKRGFPKGEMICMWSEINYKKGKVVKYYYSYKNKIEVVKSKKLKNHINYIVNISCGPLVFNEKAMSDELKKKAVKYKNNQGQIRFQCGRPDVLYYVVISCNNLNNSKTYIVNGIVYNDIMDIPFQEYTTIQGIEVTNDQDTYLTGHKYLDKNTPELNEAQLEYLKKNPPPHIDQRRR